MIARFNPTGTHIHKGFLKVRVDLYPEPTDKTYAIHHIQVPDPESRLYKKGYRGKLDEMDSPIDQGDYNAWYESLPKIWRTNPCLCHFIKVDAGTTLSGLTDYVKGILDKNTILELDDILSKVDVDHPRLSRIMNAKSGTGSKVSFAPIDLNSRLSLLEIEV